MSDNLFTDGRLSEHLEAKRQAVIEEVNRLSEADLLSGDIEEWVGHLGDKHRIAPVELHRDKMVVNDDGEVELDARELGGTRLISDYSRPVPIAGYQATLIIPFTGNPMAFRYQASTFSYNPPRAEVVGSEVHKQVTFPDDAKVNLGTEAQGLANTLEQHLGWANSDIEAHNSGLESLARDTFQARKSRLLETKKHLESAGIPIRRRDDAPTTFSPPEIKRRPRPEASTGTRPPLEPALEQAQYEHVLAVLRTTGRMMERTPDTHSRLEEEQLRDIMLGALNSHYEGGTSGETFNAAGKTDILVKSGDKNIFVGECKFWHGEKQFQEAIKQVFSYTTWRDTKIAIVVFVREKGLTNVINKAKEALQNEDNFVEWRDPLGEAELLCGMHWPGDKERPVAMNVSFVHLPAVGQKVGKTSAKPKPKSK